MPENNKPQGSINWKATILEQDPTLIFKDRLREALIGSGMKASELAEQIGVNRSAISHYLGGSTYPKKLTIAKMAHVLGVDEDWLAGLRFAQSLSKDISPIAQKINNRIMA